MRPSIGIRARRREHIASRAYLYKPSAGTSSNMGLEMSSGGEDGDIDDDEPPPTPSRGRGRGRTAGRGRPRSGGVSAPPKSVMRLDLAS
eukprot:4126881-Pyramimonas_sp.AAC.2